MVLGIGRCDARVDPSFIYVPPYELSFARIVLSGLWKYYLLADFARELGERSRSGQALFFRLRKLMCAQNVM